MKKINILLASMALVLTLGSCNKSKQPSSSGGVSSSSEASSVVSQISESLSSLDSVSSLNSQATSSSSISKISVPPYEEVLPTGNKIDATTAVALIMNAPQKDIDYAKTSVQTLEAIGYDDGRKYNQTQITNATTYENNLTIASGALQQYFYAQEDKVYIDEFDQVKMLKDETYTSMRVFKNKVFQDETERFSLLSISDPNEILQAEYYYQASATCGAGLDAYEQFMNAYQLGCSMGFSSGKTTKGDTLFVRCEYESSEAQNQMVVYEFTFVFDSFNSGFLKEYVSDQRFYSLDKYKELGDDGDELTLDPTYSAYAVSQVTPGTRSEFEGELPVDISSSFVKSITVSAAKTTIEMGETIALKTEIYPKTALNQDITFYSENESIATVDYDGRVKGISKGTTKIFARNNDSDVEGYIEITVTDKSRPDAGDDSKKADLKKALDACYNQVFKKTNWIGGQSVTSITGMCIDDSGTINSNKVASLGISNFAYDENLRKATYVGDYDVLLDVLPFIDNGNPNLTNNYVVKSGGGTIYKDNILGFEIYLKSDDTISYVKFNLRCDSAEVKNSGVKLADLTNANIEEKIGSTFEANPYDRTLYYESAGFVYDDEA